MVQQSSGRHQWCGHFDVVVFQCTLYNLTGMTNANNTTTTTTNTLIRVHKIHNPGPSSHPISFFIFVYRPSCPKWPHHPPWSSTSLLFWLCPTIPSWLLPQQPVNLIGLAAAPTLRDLSSRPWWLLAWAQPRGTSSAILLAQCLMSPTVPTTIPLTVHSLLRPGLISAGALGPNIRLSPILRLYLFGPKADALMCGQVEKATKEAM